MPFTQKNLEINPILIKTTEICKIFTCKAHLHLINGELEKLLTLL